MDHRVNRASLLELEANPAWAELVARHQESAKDAIDILTRQYEMDELERAFLTGRLEVWRETSNYVEAGLRKLLKEEAKTT